LREGCRRKRRVTERIAALLHAMADIFENHIRALNPNEANAKREIDAYERLMRDYRAAAAPVSALADAMRGYRDLPLAEHAIAVLMDSQSVDAMDALFTPRRRCSRCCASGQPSFATCWRQ